MIKKRSSIDFINFMAFAVDRIVLYLSWFEYRLEQGRNQSFKYFQSSRHTKEIDF
jgi:hypothetical protein